MWWPLKMEQFLQTRLRCWSKDVLYVVCLWLKSIQSDILELVIVLWDVPQRKLAIQSTLMVGRWQDGAPSRWGSWGLSGTGASNWSSVSSHFSSVEWQCLGAWWSRTFTNVKIHKWKWQFKKQSLRWKAENYMIFKMLWYLSHPWNQFSKY